MKQPIRHIRASVFGLAALAFLLPFVVVSCPDQGRVSVSGVQLAFGTTVKGSQLSTVSADQHIKPQLFALFAFASAVAGIVCSYLKRNPSFLLCAAAAIAGIALLLLLRNQIGTEAYRMASDNLKVRYEIGYWVATAGFILALAVTLLLNPSKKWSILSNRQKPRRRSR
jgi:hypothetical protein